MVRWLNNEHCAIPVTRVASITSRAPSVIIPSFLIAARPIPRDPSRTTPACHGKFLGTVPVRRIRGITTVEPALRTDGANIPRLGDENFRRDLFASYHAGERVIRGTGLAERWEIQIMSLHSAERNLTEGLRETEFSEVEKSYSLRGVVLSLVLRGSRGESKAQGER